MTIMGLCPGGTMANLEICIPLKNILSLNIEWVTYIQIFPSPTYQS